ncbi:MAG: hypothetical protein WCJ57_03590 [Candidatus Falkowbacteria bacterium]
MKKLIQVLPLLALVFALAGCSSQNNLTTEPGSKINKSNEQTVASTSDNNTSGNIGSIAKCDVDSKNYFDKEWKAKILNTDILKTINLSYENHYDKTNNSCYILISYNFNTSGVKYNLPSYLSVTFMMADIYRKTPDGYPMALGNFNKNVSFSDGSPDRLVDCNAFGASCSSAEGFLSLVNPYMGK